MRLELTERAQSTLAEKKRQTLQELEEERRRREEAEREREDLRRELQALREARKSPVSPAPSDDTPPYTPLYRGGPCRGSGGCTEAVVAEDVGG